MMDPVISDRHSTQFPKVSIIVLNWNGWQDTIECLESLFRLDYPSFQIILCDNASTDGSIEQIKAWAQGEVLATVRNEDLAYLTVPPVPKPILFREFTADLKWKDISNLTPDLVLIQTGGNLGFAGGNNVGLRFALAQSDCDLAWLLNNDTIVAPDALLALVERMRQRPDVGICGSTLLYYNEPETVQALGGSIYSRWTARGGHLGGGTKYDRFSSHEWVESRMNYVVGASMLVRRKFIEEVGLMSENYFLYFEEIDWATRGKGRFQLAFAPKSIVYHKEGASIGTGRTTTLQSKTSEYYATRNRVLFTARFFPLALPSVIAAICLSTLHRLIHLRIGNALVVLKACFDAALAPSKYGQRSSSLGREQADKRGGGTK